jgi:signal transduction histidine kinase
VDVFVDIEPERIEAFVRDRGEGFDLSELAQVPEDRLGVRESIIGRMRRAGGSATVRRAPGGGTEVALHLGLRSEG